MLGTLDRYVVMRLVRVFVPALLVLGFVFFLGGSFRLLKEGLSLGQLAMALPYVVPFMLPYLLPLAYLVSVTLVLGRMVAENETLAFVSVGISQARQARPVLALAVPLCLLSLWISSTVVPYCYQQQKLAERAVFERLLKLGQGEHLSFVFDVEGFDLYVRRYGPQGLEGVVIHHDLIPSGDDPGTGRPVQIVARRGSLDIGVGHGGQSMASSDRLQLTLEDATVTVQERGDARWTSPPWRAHFTRYVQVIGQSGRRRIKSSDYGTGDLRDVAEAADARARLAGAHGGLLSTRQGQDARGLDARTQLALRASVSLAPLMLALVAAPLTFLLAARSPLVPFGAGLLLSCSLFFAPMLLGRSLSDSTGHAAFLFLGCAASIAGAAGLGWLATGGASAARVVRRVGKARDRVVARAEALVALARRREAPAAPDAPLPPPPGASSASLVPASQMTPSAPGGIRRLASRLADLLRLPILDRWLAARFARAFVTFTAASALVFVVIDLFTNLESLSRRGLLHGMRLRYGTMLPELFFSMCPFLALLAALWVVSQLRRTNELVPLLAAGMGPRRIARPLLVMGALLAPLVWADRELLLPGLAGWRKELGGMRGGWEHPRPIPDVAEDAPGLQGSVFSPRFSVPQTGEVRDLRLARLDEHGGEAGTVLAEWATPIPGGWRLGPGWRIERRDPASGEDRVEPIVAGAELESPVLQQDVEGAVDTPAFQSARELRRQLRRTPGFRHLEVQLHERSTYPLSVLVLLLLAVPIALGGEGGVNAVVRALAVVGLSVGYFLMTNLGYQLGAREVLPPVVAAWGPVVLFGGAGLALTLRR